jgi:hypothetical protein
MTIYKFKQGLTIFFLAFTLLFGGFLFSCSSEKNAESEQAQTSEQSQEEKEYEEGYTAGERWVIEHTSNVEGAEDAPSYARKYILDGTTPISEVELLELIDEEIATDYSVSNEYKQGFYAGVENWLK